MPSLEPIESWAEEAEAELEGKKHLPPTTEVIVNGLKIITSYRFNDDDKLEKIVRSYKVERRKVSKSIAVRKLWKKYGESTGDKPGPNPSNTFAGEEVYMQYISGKEDDKLDENPFEKLKEQKGLVKCRTCNGDHWTLHCPYKDMMTKPRTDEKLPPASGGASGEQKYVPPSLREGGGKRGEMVSNLRHDASAIRISNLSPNTSDHDLEELVKPFGAINKLYLAKEKITGHCRGFAYIHFKSKEDARIAINKLNGYGYDHLILKVDWSKPNPN